MTYAAPLADIKFVLENVAGLGKVTALPVFAEATPDLVESILEEAAKIAADTLAPLNRIGDTDGAKLVDGKVRVSPGWQEAWNVLVDGGWNGLPFSPEHGGMGLPNVLNTAVHEMWQAANMAFTLCPMLTQGAVNAVESYGTAEQKALYLPKMVTGEWTGTMNLTEPGAGSDLAAIRTKAVPEGDHYRISGSKIFITYGDHEMVENIIHLVLARLPDAPAGVKGISLFIVPKFLVNADGSLGARNDAVCASLEHKLGIHGSPTAVMAFGEKDGAIGTLVGEANRGLEYMFTMMNHARQAVGLQGLAIAERAYQQALYYARERVQGKPTGWTGSGPTGIVNHPDVRRMLMTMKCQIEAMRGLIYSAAAYVDIAHNHDDAAERARAQLLADLYTPLVKGWSTELGNVIASLGVQVHGGMGYVEETGAAQHFRDARITTIYEGTTAIQANDLVLRKTLRDGGQGIRVLLADVAATADAAAAAGLAIGAKLKAAINTAIACTDWLVGAAKEDPRLPAGAAVPFLELMGIVVGAQMMAKAAVVAQGATDGFLAAKLVTADFYADHVLSKVDGLGQSIQAGSKAIMALDEALL
ncbi:acyl-CoA dehydrogenase [Magnetospirillum gryphiswaldense]|uniref:3-methylmercaptopropionyl-CoA dehydrogenase n=1 Tax=Magnetospirillum gryphiswaldense TaxID=55518 RepID=A4U285_9PROT|nr:acyl-CoA dehydrogenase [Magnetospirillum gryphiswaldense]AVM73981.1 Acyl-CoA dehydrogenase [Magnetospirillum gryphiswaldense MSR-1]AVM77884.1 Acyl-CoA dehydrogenase [Magnetospirillum gryphiswaldense]CAM76992.1 acyl-CoA dehydrogenase family protein [Magnetospirillum gryphiswaldense MSR-1]